MPSYLLDVCDFNISYQGCSNKADMALVDLVFIVLHSISTLMYIVHLVMRFWSGKLSRKLTNMETVAVLCVVLNILRVLFRVSTRLSGLTSFESDDAIIANIRFSLYLEHFFSLVGSLALKLVLLAMVEAVTSASLIVPVNIFGREVDPSTILKIIRLIAMIINFTWYSLWVFWAVSAVGDFERYKLMRRLTYITWACVSGLISAPVNYYYGTKLIAAQSAPALSMHVEIPKSAKKDMMLLKYAFYGVLTTYIWIGIYFPLYVIFNETLQSNHNALLVVKIFIDSALIVVTSFILFFMFQKGN
ncbi:hypothetical protein EDD86DRAFT_276243 [Gorgonomyces haynaldii]|nr:hypothetical protein EDD86DRAFT_276243 [Gorgonomyces haynaldii]